MSNFYVTRLPYKSLKNNEHLEYFDKMCRIMSNYNIAELGFWRRFSDFKRFYNAEVAISKVQHSSQTMADARHEVDKAFRRLAIQLEALCYITGAEQLYCLFLEINALTEEHKAILPESTSE